MASQPIKQRFLFPNVLVLVKGGGDLGTGAAYRLHRAGFPVCIAELAQPLVVRRTVSFASAVFEGRTAVEGVTAERTDSFEAAVRLVAQGTIPVLVDPLGEGLAALKPSILVDAIMAKRNAGTSMGDAPFVVALGPGFMPGVDCHAVVETNRGHDLGRVYWDRAAEPNTGTPGEIGGKGAERVLRAPRDGLLQGVRQIGDQVTAGQVIARVDEAEVRSPFDGILRGIVRDGVAVKRGMKIGDVDPRAKREACFTISDKALAVGGGVVEAALVWLANTGAREVKAPRRSEVYSGL